jgi:transcription antitermination factor NusG
MVAKKAGPNSRFDMVSHPIDAAVKINDLRAGERWYVVHTQPRAESRATIHVERQAFRVFCPHYRKTVRHARKGKSVFAALFTNYLFVRLDDGAIDWTPTFKIGQAVRIAEGPFAELLGTLEHLDAGGRVRVLLDLLGRSVSVALRCEALMSAA